jgi:Gas vesicle synthesis protein GvpO
MRLRKSSLALATAIVALATVTAMESASAQRYDRGLTVYETESLSGLARVDGGWELAVDVVELRRVPDTTARPSNRDMRGMPSMGGRGMRGGGRGRMNGGMGRR